MIQVDFSRNIGRLKNLNGANIGPLCVNGYVDVSSYHRRVRFPTIRLHDCLYYNSEVVDVPCIFPFPQLDTGNPDHYLFARTDRYLQSIVDCGSQIVYRLGVSIGGDPPFQTYPPADFDKWADICIHIIRHYNDGWANGFHHAIRYWEIWNEPDNGPGMWNASYDEYIRFYIHVAKRIKAACPDIKIGGPAFNGAFLTDWSRMHDFLPPVREADAPLDFCSWHAYPEHPRQMAIAARNVRAILDHYGYQKTESHLNEWNLAPFKGKWGGGKGDVRTHDWNVRKKGAEGGALAACCLIAFQDAPVDMTNYYDAANGPFGMFSDAGLPAKPYYAFLAFRELLDRTPLRCAASGADLDQGLGALAGSAADGSLHQIIIANFDCVIEPDGRETVAVAGLPTDSRWEVEHRILDSHANLEPQEPSRLEQDVRPFELLIRPRSVHLLTLRRMG